ncbi:DUF5689 domain-containing protein [Chitinophaga sp. HK235]|uniref:DUF5689 domain-containing protein n=1 Tax=Chitinophaga sp. HK235 TaxID=2952571 RepID=UPI001BABAA8D|nr:DUF5689 domain-containing protein [Chitinophaga sp. HK235]
MNKININIYFSLLCSLVFLWGCKKESYPGGEISQYIGILDIRTLYKGSDVTLTRENMDGSDKLAAVVVSDHTGGNMPAGLLVVQDSRRLSKIRGISIALGADAAKYVPGDSVIINVEGAVLKRVNGILQLTGINNSAVTKVASGLKIPLNRVTSSQLLAFPDNYESTLSVVIKGGLDPLPPSPVAIRGEKVLTDGFGNVTVHTENTATFADNTVPFLANYFGIVFNAPSGDTLAPQLRLRSADDVTVLSSAVTLTPLVISGFVNDPISTDANYEYVQLLATQDIDFSVTPYCLVTNNNANASTPTGFPVNGWATGGLRSYKINITSGKVAKGKFCYVGGTTKMIMGDKTTVLSDANWVKVTDYSKVDGDDFGTKTGNLLANSGNAFGIAVFAGTKVTAATVPVDAIFISGGGSIYSAGPPPVGYRITNNDFYDIKDPITLKDQPFFKAGTNSVFLSYLSTDGIFVKLGGVYNPSLGRWVKARTQVNTPITKTSVLAEIEEKDVTTLK